MAIALRARRPGDLRLRPDGVRRAAVRSRWRRSTAPPGSGRSARWASPSRWSSMLTFLPALLLIAGRRPFWPFIPRVGDDGAGRDARLLAPGRRPRRAQAGTRRGRDRRRAAWSCALGVLNFSTGLTQGNQFRDYVESIEGQALIAEGVPERHDRARGRRRAGGRRRRRRRARGRGRPGGGVRRPRDRWRRTTGRPSWRRSSAVDPYSTTAYDVVPKLRDAVHDGRRPARSSAAPTAVERDLRGRHRVRHEAARPDRARHRLRDPRVLLRALVAPLLLIATVVLSYAAALGVGAVVFDVVFGFPGSDPGAAAVRVHLPRRAGRRLQHLPHGPRPGGDAPARDTRGDAARPGGDRRRSSRRPGSCSRARSRCSRCCR